MTEEHDARELHDVIAELPDRYVECRLADHRWKRQGDPVREVGGTYLIRWRCPSCRCRRFDRVVLSSGTLYARWYERPPGYDIKGFGHASRRKALYRVALIERLGDEE